MRVRFTRDAQGRGAGTVEDFDAEAGRYLVACGDATVAAGEALVFIAPAPVAEPEPKAPPARRARRKRGA